MSKSIYEQYDKYDSYCHYQCYSCCIFLNPRRRNVTKGIILAFTPHPNLAGPNGENPNAYVPVCAQYTLKPRNGFSKSNRGSRHSMLGLQQRALRKSLSTSNAQFRKTQINRPVVRMLGSPRQRCLRAWHGRSAKRAKNSVAVFVIRFRLRVLHRF